MFCPNCGTKNEDDAVFCGNCGTKLNLDDFNETLNAAANETAEAADVANQAADTVDVAANQATDAFVNQEAQPVQGFANGFDPNANQNFNNGFDANANQNFNNGFDANANQNFSNGFDANANQNFNNGFDPNANQNFNNGYNPNYANNGYNQAPYQQQPAKPFKLNKKIVGIAVAVVAVIVAIVAFVSIGKAGVDYKKTAKKYVTAIEQCDWDTAYDLINLPDSEFLTKEALINAHADATGEKVTGITVTDAYSTAGSTKGSATVKVTYSTATSNGNQSTYVLSQTNDKYLLFFKKYKVSSEGLVYKNTSIQVPKGCTLSINGVEVKSNYIKADNSSYGSYYDTYVIPYIFAGDNKIKLTSDVTEDYETSINVSYDESLKSISYSDLSFTDDAEKAAMEKAQSDIATIAKAAYEKKGYSDIKSLVSSEADVEDEYDDLVDDFHQAYSSYSRDVTSYDLSAVKATVGTKYFTLTDEGAPKMRIYLGYTISGKYKYTGYGSEEEKSGSYTYNSYYYIDYVYEDGEWLIDDVYLNFYFY
ncbi:zinc ribbon domain-containing protein [Lachnospira sp.]|jgi:uncharacterized membrane protein YvbJ|uniref:zinc ribbon domain-containing protein n=1 Tax=Lachnospira sp. TaxID=2049031 RepID=UPI002579C3C7|nr:zinc ribbon domain-containing protein [Lachnospira sp.]